MDLSEIAETLKLYREYERKAEGIIRAGEIELKPYPTREVTIATGQKMTIRQAGRSDIPEILTVLKPLIDFPKDYYDLVCTRTYAEALAWQYHRYKNIWFLVGEVEGKIVGIADGRLFDEKVGISLHTIADPKMPRTGLGAHMAAAKWEYFFEPLGVEEVWITSESSRGLNDILRWKPAMKPGQHELGGASIYVITRELYEKAKPNRKERLGW